MEEFSNTESAKNVFYVAKNAAKINRLIITLAPCLSDK